MAADSYAWWYLDAVSDDGRHALTLIAFIGSVFSPYYAAARRRGRGDPCDHVAINLALYGDGPRRWTMTERGRSQLQRSARELRIGRSALRWEGDALHVALDEHAAPWPSAVRGSLLVVPSRRYQVSLALDASGHHRWQPIAPHARVTLALDSPALRWSGQAYLDCNWGDEPLERAFSGWHWSRTVTEGPTCVAHYDLQLRDGSQRQFHLRMSPDGRIETAEAPALGLLPRTRWGLQRQARGAPALLATLEDGPFYARSLMQAGRSGPARFTVHETLSLDRFRQRWVQVLLPFRMPRWAHG